MEAGSLRGMRPLVATTALVAVLACGPAVTPALQSSDPAVMPSGRPSGRSSADGCGVGVAGCEVALPGTAPGPPSANRGRSEPATWLDYDPQAASHLDRIRDARWVGLSAAAEAQLGAQGMVVLDGPRPDSFATGMAEIFYSDLPIWITADSILYALHRSFEDTLGLVEERRGLPLLQSMLRNARRALSAVQAEPEARAEVDEYLTIAASLAAGRDLPCSANGSSSAAWATVRPIVAASGGGVIDRFGRKRREDFTLYAPRGHHAKSAALTGYARALTWLRRVPVVLVRTEEHEPVLVPAGLEAAQVLARCLQADGGGAYRRLDRFIRAVAGARESLDPQQIRRIAWPGAPGQALIGRRRTAVLAELSRAHRTRRERVGLGPVSTRPEQGDWITLSLVGRRVPPDTRALDTVVRQVVTSARELPTALEVGYAALGHQRSIAWLPGAEAAIHPLGELAALRGSIDQLPASYWESSLYTRWLGALRTLSPLAPGSTQTGSHRPAIVASEPWARRILVTQLASWAELRHDSSLYLELSHARSVCEFPDAYVDPYPELWAGLGAWIDAVGKMVTASGARGKRAKRAIDWSRRARKILGRLESIARHQDRGEPLTPADLAWINRAVQVDQVDCSGTTDRLDGWFHELFVDPEQSLVPTPVVTPVLRVERGPLLGRVLHAGVGDPRVMVVAIDGPTGPRGFVGLVSSFYEHSSGSAIDDQRWLSMVRSPLLSTPGWVEPLLAK